MMNNWTCVYSSNQAYQLNIAHDVLEAEGIESVIVNKIDSSYLYGESELYVKKEDALMALQIIEKIKNE